MPLDWVSGAMEPGCDRAKRQEKQKNIETGRLASKQEVSQKPRARASARIRNASAGLVEPKVLCIVKKRGAVAGSAFI